MKKRWELYLNLGLIILILIAVFYLALKIYSDNVFPKIDFYNFHQVNNKLNEPNQNREENRQYISSSTASAKNERKLPNSQKIPILMYHYIDQAPATSSLPGLYLKPLIFENQLKEIKAAGYNPLFISEIALDLKNKQTLPQKSLALTFDDGYQDFYTQAWPLLKKYNIKATLYVIINALDKPGYLKTSELKELAQSGLIEIGSHTFNHPNLKTLNARQANYEINLSRQALAKLSGGPILSFAYPYGLYNNDDLKISAKAGYLAAVSTNPGSQQSPINLMSLNRLRPNERQGSDFIKWLNEWE